MELYIYTDITIPLYFKCLLVINLTDRFGCVSNLTLNNDFEIDHNRYLVDNIKDFLKEAAKLKNYYYVTKEDLKGEIADFPVEIVQHMLNNQTKEDGKANIKFFQNSIKGGFIWRNTPEGTSFWNDVIKNKNFDRYFEKYPKIEIDIETNQKQFTKEDLQSGMVVEIRRGNKYLVVGDLLINNIGFIRINNYNENLISIYSNEWDIMKIYDKSEKWGNGFNDGIVHENTIWERNELITMSIKEIEIKLNLQPGTLRIKK